MDPRHHPDDETLLAKSTGNLGAGPWLIVTSHVETCARCRERLRVLNALGGMLLEDMEPADLSADALARVWARIDAMVAAPSAARSRSPKPPLPDEARWPYALMQCEVTPWKWMGPGMRWSRVTVPGAPDANVFLLRIAAGKSLPRHTHAGEEWTQVLHGSFHDGRALLGPGDYDAADATVHHQPVVQASGECICLAALSGQLKFESPFVRLLASATGF